MRGWPWCLGAGGLALAGSGVMLAHVLGDAAEIGISCLDLPYEMALAYAVNFTDPKLPAWLWGEYLENLLGAAVLAPAGALLLRKGLAGWLRGRREAEISGWGGSPQ